MADGAIFDFVAARGGVVVEFSAKRRGRPDNWANPNSGSVICEPGFQLAVFREVAKPCLRHAVLPGIAAGAHRGNRRAFGSSGKREK